MITEIITQPEAIAWLPWAVTYFFFIGISYGAVLLTLPAILLGKKQYDKIARLAILVMMVSVLAAMAGLLGDLHQPGRFWHFYAYITPNSWMSMGALMLPIYMLAIFAYGLLYLRIRIKNTSEALTTSGLSLLVSGVLSRGTWQGEKFLKPMALLTMLMALLIILYTGSEVIIVKARPLWHSNFLLFFYFSSALSGAIAISLLIALLSNVELSSRQTLARWLRWSIVLFLAISLAWINAAYFGEGTPADALARIQGSEAFINSVIILLGVAVMALLLSFFNGGFLWLASVAGLMITWQSRWLIFIDGQRIPKYGSGFYPYEMPMGGDGLLGIVGIFGLALFLTIVLYQYLPWQFSLLKPQADASTSNSTH